MQDMSRGPSTAGGLVQKQPSGRQNLHWERAGNCSEHIHHSEVRHSTEIMNMIWYMLC